MARHVVEVVARFGTTIIDVAHVESESVYQIGTTSIPIGATLRTGVTGIDVGHVRVELTRVRLDPPRVPRAAMRWKMPAFAAVSLLAHLALWLCAAVFEPFERLVEEPRPKLRLIHVEPELPPPQPTPPPVQARTTQPTPAVSQPRRRVREHMVAAAAEGGGSWSPAERQAATGRAMAALASAIANTHVVERVEALKPEDTYNEDDANLKGFGGSPRFPPGETIKTGDYELMLYDVKLCAKKSCTVSGPIPPEFVRAQLHEHMDAIYACFTEHADGPGDIVLEFTIAGDGSVHNARGTGLGETGACAARVLPDLYFKAIGDNDVPDGKQRVTHVRYPIHFN